MGSLYGKQNLDGTWNFSENKEPGMIPIEVDNEGKAQHGALIKIGEEYKLDSALLTSIDNSKKSKDALRISIKGIDFSTPKNNKELQDIVKMIVDSM